MKIQDLDPPLDDCGGAAPSPPADAAAQADPVHRVVVPLDETPVSSTPPPHDPKETP